MDIVGLNEISEIADVTPSAVANWRRRFTDFPKPLADLKSGPVFAKEDVLAWIARRGDGDLVSTTRFYDQLAAARGDSPELVAAVEEAVAKLSTENTSTGKPGVLLGKIQSGKTRAYLGIVARAFDRGYDVAVILTKGTKSLAKQTLSRVKWDFRDFVEADQVQVFDIMALPALTPYELSQKLVLVVKKEDDNLARLLTAFGTAYPELLGRRVLIVDDEADLASVSFRRQDGLTLQGKLSAQIDRLREMVADAAFLQVTATPYSLYLQPTTDIPLGNGETFKPKRPQFTVILPAHAAYVGGEYYFERSSDPTSPTYYFYKEVPAEERDALKAEDRRRLKIENVLSEPRAAMLREALMTFVVGAVIRRMQEKQAGRHPKKYSLLFHTEHSRASHAWQERVATAIRDGLVADAAENTPRFAALFAGALADLARSVELAGMELPDGDDIKAQTTSALAEGQLMITKVNSDKEIDELLDANGQLRLRTPLNMFIGGQILERGITIGNLIGFYYGRDPRRFQQDTVLQHSRMYGVRPPADLGVTRFYAPLRVYQAMKKIHFFDAGLREAFETGAHERGVYFIQRDTSQQLIPCSPNKLMLSDVTTIRPGRRMLPVGFQTVAKTRGQRPLQKVDDMVERAVGAEYGEPAEVPIDVAVALLQAAYELLEFDNDADDERAAHIAALEHLSRVATDRGRRGKAVLLAVRDRNVARYREEGRFSNSPDTKQQADLAQQHANTLPVLMLLRQNGELEQGWRGLPFWWPVIVTPSTAATSIFTTSIQPQSTE